MKSKLLLAGFLVLAFSSAQVIADHDDHEFHTARLVKAPEKHVRDMRGTISIQTFETVNPSSGFVTVHTACTTENPTCPCTDSLNDTDTISAVDQIVVRGEGFSIGTQNIIFDSSLAAAIIASGTPVTAAANYLQITEIKFDKPFKKIPTVVLSLENDNATIFSDNNAVLYPPTLRASEVTKHGFTIVLQFATIGASLGAISKLLGTRFCGPNANINFIVEAPFDND